MSDETLRKALRERDDAQKWADRLAYAIAPVEVIGEHSNLNNPWQNALDELPPAPAPTVDALDAETLARAMASVDIGANPSAEDFALARLYAAEYERLRASAPGDEG